MIEEFDAKVSEDDPNGLRGFTCSVAVGWRKFVLGTTTTFFILVKRDAFWRRVEEITGENGNLEQSQL